MLNVTAHLHDISNREFDYIVVGGGTSGLVVAARLTEDPSVTVAVLEAGGIHIGHPSVEYPAQYGKELGNTDFANACFTVPQKHVNNRSLHWVSGNGLGGSSAQNYFLWQRPPANDIDAWSVLGNEGWNWELFSKYMRKTETFIPPPPERAKEYGITFDPKEYGQNGPLLISIGYLQLCGESSWRETTRNCSIPLRSSPRGREVTGACIFPSTINPKTGLRSYAANCYFHPNACRSNLKVLVNAKARKVIIPSVGSPGKEVTASGVEFKYEDGIHLVHAKKEVIICSGVALSSSLLEHSGIGNQDILQSLGIQVKVHNSNVGENLQEHCIAALIHEVDAKSNGFDTMDSLADPEYAAEARRLHSQGLGAHRTAISDALFLPLKTVSPERYSSLVADEEKKIALLQREGYFKSRPGLSEQYKLQLNSLKEGRNPECEAAFLGFFFPVPCGVAEKGRNYISHGILMNKPFSRGSIHIKSNDPHVRPDLDPHYFEHDIDLQNMVEMLKCIRRITNVEPYKKHVVREVFPGPGCKSDEEIAEYLRSTVASGLHHAGTCCMLPRENGGVVDSNLRVYGTTNIRVGDLSIIPLHVSAHTQLIAYTVAEILADKIKGKI